MKASIASTALFILLSGSTLAQSSGDKAVTKSEMNRALDAQQRQIADDARVREMNRQAAADAYNGPSRFTNPRLRAHFGAAGATVDPALAADLDARINRAGGTHTSKAKHATVFNSGEFSGKTLPEAVGIITAQFNAAKIGRPAGTMLDRR
jgi:hypothetical protein